MTVVLRGSSLGSVIRNYEDSSNWEYGRATPIPQHRKDDNVEYMRSDDNDTLLVQAACGRHTTRLTRKQVFDGVEAPCPHRFTCRTSTIHEDYETAPPPLCPEHYRYRAIQKPRVECPTCLAAWHARA